jgi:hypothetical protein
MIQVYDVSVTLGFVLLVLCTFSLGVTDTSVKEVEVQAPVAENSKASN